MVTDDNNSSYIQPNYNSHEDMDHCNLVCVENCQLIIIDFQTAFKKIISNYVNIRQNICKYIALAKLLNIPITLTEQYPKGLKSTDFEILKLLDNHHRIYEKTSFGIANDQNILQAINNHNKHQLIICGLESHVCIMLSSLELLAKGYNVYLATDAVASSNKLNHDTAIQRLKKNNKLTIISLEMLAFELIKDSKHQNFNQIRTILFS